MPTISHINPIYNWIIMFLDQKQQEQTNDKLIHYSFCLFRHAGISKVSKQLTENLNMYQIQICMKENRGK